jgi:hypothetical protein
MEKVCNTHPEVSALTDCSRCGRSYCDPCLPALVEGLCACAGCANAERAQTGRPWGFAAVVLLACVMGSLGFARAEIRATGSPSWEIYGLACALALGFAGFIVSRKRTGGSKVEPREPGNEPEDARRAGPYRQMARRVVARKLPPVSGRLTAFTVLMCCAFCALTMPFALHLPRWVETEIVFGACWFVWTGVLAATLYRGSRIADDHRFDPTIWFMDKKKEPPSGKPGKQGKQTKKGKDKSGGGGGGGGWSIGDIGNLGDAGEGCLILIGAVLLAGAAILTAWLLVELVIPALFTLAYLLLIRALKLATNDESGCAGDVSRSLRRGAMFATIYVGPLLVLAALVHLVARKSGVF